MLSTAERLAAHHATAWVGADSFDPIASHVAGFLAGDPEVAETRRMTMIRYYLHGTAGQRTEIATSLSLDPHRHPAGRINLACPSNGAARHFFVDLGPGTHGFGFNLSDQQTLTEAQVNRRWQAHQPDDDGTCHRRRGLTQVTFTGRPGQPNRDDRIAVETWNEHGVGTRTVIAFEASQWEIEADRRQTEWLRP